MTDLTTLVTEIDPTSSMSDAELDRLLPDDELHALVAARLAAPPRPHSRRAERRSLSSTRIGAVTVAGAVAVIAAILAVTAGSGPQFALAPSTGMDFALGAFHGAPDSSWTYPVPSAAAYRIAGFPSLSAAGGTAPAYQVTGPTDLRAEAQRVAVALGVPGEPTTDGSGAWQVGTLSPGPSTVVAVNPATGLGNISYVGPNGTESASVCPVVGAPIDTDVTAMTASTTSLLASLGLDYGITGAFTSEGPVPGNVCGVPPVARMNSLVAQVTVDGTPVDGVDLSVGFNQDGQVVEATLPDFSTTTSTVALTSSAAAARSLSTYERSLGTWIKRWDEVAPTGVRHGPPPSRGGVRRPSTTSVRFTSKRLELGPELLASGQTWLLPRYVFTGEVVSTRAAFRDSALALAPRLVSSGSTDVGLPNGVPAPPTHP